MVYILQFRAHGFGRCQKEFLDLNKILYKISDDIFYLQILKKYLYLGATRLSQVYITYFIEYMGGIEIEMFNYFLNFFIFFLYSINN